MIEMAVPSRRKRVRPRRRWMDLAREDIGRDRTKEGDEVDRVKWKIFSHCGQGEAENRRSVASLLLDWTTATGTA